ncbi:hypothetical protein OAE19_08705 [Porticoccaceae bacterium]|nr:hypothetical protein [Porticoccaceae bacterium]
MPKTSVFQRLWLPGFLLQSVIIGGGYATGRELVEFFLAAGPIGGLLGMLLATVALSVITALCFELARLTKSYNYRSFFHPLLGRGWFLYELAYFSLGLLILAVIGAAAGELVSEHLGLNKSLGTVTLMVLIGLLVFWGTALIEKVLAGWSFLLYATYAVFVVCYLWQYGGDLVSNLTAAPIIENNEHWMVKSFQYVGYNVAVIPVILFCVKHMTTRRDALTAGVLAGPLAMIPAYLFFLAMVSTYPTILQSAVPADFMMQRLGLPWLKIIFYIVVFGTFVETGAAYIHAVNERIDEVFAEKKRRMPLWLRPLVAFIALIVSIVLAGEIGLIDLIAKGYGTLTWVFMLIFIAPLLTVGLFKVYQGNTKRCSDNSDGNIDLKNKPLTANTEVNTL